MAQKNKNRKYAITVSLPVDQTGVCPVGSRNTGSVTIVNLPFLLTKITHGIMGNNHLGAGASLTPIVYQDGQYTLQWRTDQHNYESEPILAGPGYGMAEDHFKLATPEELPPKTTITIEVVNQIQRTAATTIQFVFHGLEPNLNVQDQGAS
jgi:hypothetical protein